ncbi:hypothetical protein LX64_00646 [Chitinophaga skermanii]|uniref:Uncharacterized protein n=1 Tax=Chitinophaga skermanii TaxID=331697 RepID=A0A327R2H5_9BACT|nr:hypothetical protein [Chitinophaga skermanii]RAJ11039.1 hypothetical protein LX64_00646 [Chitinophaga skermanii]
MTKEEVHIIRDSDPALSYKGACLYYDETPFSGIVKGTFAYQEFETGLPHNRHIRLHPNGEVALLARYFTGKPTMHYEFSATGELNPATYIAYNTFPDYSLHNVKNAQHPGFFQGELGRLEYEKEVFTGVKVGNYAYWEYSVGLLDELHVEFHQNGELAKVGKYDMAEKQWEVNFYDNGELVNTGKTKA